MGGYREGHLRKYISRLRFGEGEGWSALRLLEGLSFLSVDHSVAYSSDM